MKIGSIKITRIEEYRGPAFMPNDLLPDWSADAVAAHLNWLEPRYLDRETGRLVMSCHSWLVETEHHKILIDTCTGNHKQRPGGAPLFDMLNTPYMNRFASTGVRPEEIDYVLCTHLHADHVGWNTVLSNGRWVPTFPNAKYVMSKTDYEALSPEGGGGSFAAWGSLLYEDSILPVIENRQELLVDGGFQIGDNLFAEDSPGHSPGHLLFALRDSDREGLFVGDIVHHPIQVYYPEWHSAFCFDADQATKTRKGVLERACDRGSVLLPAHFAGRGACCVSHSAKGFACIGLDEGSSTISEAIHNQLA